MKGLNIKLALLTVLTAVSAHAGVLYDNSTNKLNIRFNAGVEFGDEIRLQAPTLTGFTATITNFTFEYVGLDFSGNEQARLRFYANDGVQETSGGAGSAFKPGSMLFDTDFFPIDPTDTNGLSLEFSGLSLTNIPTSFTWAVTFSGVTGTESVGLNLYSPPSVGQNFKDYWENTAATGWELKRNANGITPMDFGARVSGELVPVIPEPGTVGLFALSSLVLGWTLRRRRA